MGKRNDKVGASPARPLDHPAYTDQLGKDIKSDNKNAAIQETWSGWPLYQGKQNPPVRVRLDDKAALEVIQGKVSARARGEHWPGDFDKQGDLKINRANYG
jgi:hypothetical protein